MRAASKHSGRGFQIDFPVPTGGLNVAQPASKIGMDQVSDEENMWMSPEGLYETRPGLARITPELTPFPAAITGAFYSAALMEHLVSCADGNLYSLDLTTGVYTLIGALTGENDQVDFDDFMEACYIASGGALQSYDGTTLSAVTSATSNPAPTKAKFVESWGARLWVGEDPSKVSYCGTRAVTDWGGTLSDSGGFIYIEDGDGAVLSGLGLVEGMPLVFKSRIGGQKPYTVARITGSSVEDYCPKTLTKGLSCTNGFTVSPLQNDLLFAGMDGLFSLSQLEQYVNPRPFALSLRVAPLFRNYTPRAGIYVPKLGYYLLITNLYTLAWHQGTQSWHQWVHPGELVPKALGLDFDGDVLVGAANGHVYRLTRGSFDDGDDRILSMFQTGTLSGQTPQAEKLWKWLHIAYLPLAAGSFSVSWRRNWARTWVRAAATAIEGDEISGWDGNLTWDTEGTSWDLDYFQMERRRLSYRGRDIQVQVSATGPFRFEALGMNGALLGSARDAWK